MRLGTNPRLLGERNNDPGLDHPQSGFSEPAFLELAANRGGFDALVEQVLEDIDDPGRTVLGQKVDSGLFDLSNLRSLGKGLAGALGSYIAREAIGWGFAYLGLPTSQSLIQNQLDAIAAQLQQIETELNALLQQVAQLATNVLTTSISAALADIPDFNRRFTVALSGADTDGQVAQLVNEILEHTDWIALIDQAQRGINGGQGLQSLTLQTVSPNFTDIDTQGVLLTQAVHYQSYQMYAANLLVEACHAVTPLRPFDAEAYLDEFFITQKRQNASLKLADLVTPDQFTPTIDSNQDTILPWPPPPNLGILQLVVYDYYPTVAGSLLYDTENGKVWYYSGVGPMSLMQTESFASTFSYHGYSWRLPGLAEIRGMRRGITADMLARFNLQTAGTSSGYENYVWTRDSEVANGIQGDSVRNALIYDFFGDSDGSVGPYTTDDDSDGPREPVEPDLSPILMPALLVADLGSSDDDPSLQVTIEASEHGAKCTGQLVYSQTDASGSMVSKSLDVTNRVVWGIEVNGAADDTNLRAHIDNSPDGSGTLRFRKQIAPGDQVVVTAELGKLTAQQSVATGTPDLTPTGLLLSPNRLRVAGQYPNTQRLNLFLVTADGYYDPNVGTNQVTFSSNNPAVTVSPGGTVTATNVTAETQVIITATYDDGVHPAVSGAMLMILEPE